MPGSNGLELLRQIRSGQTPARRDIGFIILTSHSNTEVLSAAMALDVNGFIVKPFTTRVILINMKAMDSVTAVIKMTDRGGEPLWKISHWTFIRNTPGPG
jgi:DNA-binding NarL/FixJ family response regulator